MTRVFRHVKPNILSGRECLLSVRALKGTDLELPEDALRLDLPGVSAAHQVVLQHGAGREGEVAHLHTEELHRRVLHR